jgi:predicted permease
LTAIIDILFQTILPIILIAAAGYVLQRRMRLDVRSISRICLYVLNPCLGFSSMAQSKMDASLLGRMAAVSALTIIAMVIIGALATSLLRGSRQQRSAMQLALAFSNSGNFGLSVCLLAFGEAGLSLGMVYFIAMSLMLNSLGVFLASRGGKAGSVRASLRNMFGMPLLYAAVLGLVVNFAGITVPAPLLKATDLAGKAAVPVMLLVLGMQLASARVGEELKFVSVGAILKLFVAPMVALGFAGLLRLSGLPWQIAILETAMPTAVSTVIISQEFEASPAFTSSMVLVTTVLSVATLTGALALIS